MPSKTEEYLALAQRTANGLTRYWESWTDYLTTASRLYKYPFADQLMIYAQRPDATACADFDIWNNRMNRYVRRGAKGIALGHDCTFFYRQPAQAIVTSLYARAVLDHLAYCPHWAIFPPAVPCRPPGQSGRTCRKAPH